MSKVPKSKLSPEGLKALVNTFRESKAQAGYWDDARKESQSVLIGALASEDKTEATYSEDGVTTTVKVITSSTLVYDEAGLEQALGELWDRVTVRKLDTSKLESAIALGMVSAEDVAAYVTEQPRSPYVKLSDKGGN